VLAPVGCGPSGAGASYYRGLGFAVSLRSERCGPGRFVLDALVGDIESCALIACGNGPRRRADERREAIEVRLAFPVIRKPENALATL